MLFYVNVEGSKVFKCLRAEEEILESKINYWLEEAEDREAETIELLQFLVNLKKHKDENGKTDYYNEYRNQAWFNAEQLLNKLIQEATTLK